MVKNIFTNVPDLKLSTKEVLKIKSNGNVAIIEPEKLKNSLIDTLIYTAVFSPDPATQEVARWIIRRTGVALGIFPASIQPIYEAMGREEIKGFTVPAINLRGITYDAAQAVFRAAIKRNVGPVIFEIAKSEIGYTLQKPAEYTCAVTAAAIKTGYSGPIFMQGDHFQFNAKKFAADPHKELTSMENITLEALLAGFYNIDIDASTLVDLLKQSTKEQQANNIDQTLWMLALIRALAKENLKGIEICVGGEIGEVGGKNSTEEDLMAFMDGCAEKLSRSNLNIIGLSKISVQTGTTHGGVPLSDGSVAKVKIDFEVLQKLSELARDKYRLAGAVQHGASTLPNEAFDKFPAVGTAEIHLATGFQNIIYDSSGFPKDLREKMYEYFKDEMKGEWKEGDTKEQFIYKTRKKGFGPFKLEMWTLPEENLHQIGAELEKQFSFLFKKLGMDNTQKIVKKYINPVDVPLELPAALYA